MKTVLVPRTFLELRYNNTDITADIAADLQAFDYCDAASGEADSLTVTIADPDTRWRGAWSPDIGATLTAAIIDQREDGSRLRLPCGTFGIDGHGYEFLPDAITLQSTSAAITTAMRREKHTARWERITLRELGSQIATRHSVVFKFLGTNPPAFARLEQRGKSDLDFLAEIAAREGFAVKVDQGAIVIYARSAQDRSAPVATFSPLPGDRVGVKCLQTYRRCEVKFNHPDKKLTTATYTPPNAPKVGQILQIRAGVASTAEALRLARHRLEAANRGLEAAEIERPGDTRLVSGVTVRLDAGYGVYAGVYSIEEARHSGWPYRTHMKLVKV